MYNFDRSSYHSDHHPVLFLLNVSSKNEASFNILCSFGQLHQQDIVAKVIDQKKKVHELDGYAPGAYITVVLTFGDLDEIKGTSHV